MHMFLPTRIIMKNHLFILTLTMRKNSTIIKHSAQFVCLSIKSSHQSSFIHQSLKHHWYTVRVNRLCFTKQAVSSVKGDNFDSSSWMHKYLEMI
jgi:hypothetical protein